MRVPAFDQVFLGCSTIPAVTGRERSLPATTQSRLPSGPGHSPARAARAQLHAKSSAAGSKPCPVSRRAARRAASISAREKSPSRSDSARMLSAPAGDDCFLRTGMDAVITHVAHAAEHDRLRKMRRAFISRRAVGAGTDQRVTDQRVLRRTTPPVAADRARRVRPGGLPKRRAGVQPQLVPAL